MIQNKEHEKTKTLANKKVDIENSGGDGQQRRQARKRRRGASGAGNQGDEQSTRIMNDKSGVEAGQRAQNTTTRQRQRRK